MQGQVALSGHMLPNTVTIGFALRAPPGTRHGQHEISTGNLALLMPGEEHHAFYMPDSLYLATTIRPERLEMEGAHEDLVFDRHKFAGSGVHRYKAPPGVTAAPVRDLIAALRLMRRVIVTYFGRAAHGRALTAQPGLQSRIFARAQRHIEEHLDGHITIDALAAAAFTSRRTLYRTFLRMVDESPQAYVRRLRLHRLRYDLVSEAEARCTVEMAATRWAWVSSDGSPGGIASCLASCRRRPSSEGVPIGGAGGLTGERLVPRGGFGPHPGAGVRG